MKSRWILMLSIFVTNSATARGWRSYSTGPDWLYKLMLVVMVCFLLYFLVKMPFKTIGGLFGVGFALAMILIFDYLDKSFGFFGALIAFLIMMYLDVKFISFIFKNHNEN